MAARQLQHNNTNRYSIDTVDSTIEKTISGKSDAKFTEVMRCLLPLHLPHERVPESNKHHQDTGDDENALVEGLVGPLQSLA